MLKMSKKKKQDWMSFTDKDGRWMQCKHCYEYVKVDKETSAITCGDCTVKLNLIKFKNTLPKSWEKKSTGRPAGWHFMNEYVDKDGNVFHKGKEQPKLKGTLEPTKVKPRKKRKKLTADEKLQRDLNNWKKRKKARRGKK
jgi:DNA-directed RNA polymerase subunit RPC12/RpoP